MDATINVSVIATANDQEAQRKALGGFKFPLGTVLASICKDGKECAVEPFIPDSDKTGAQKFSDWLDLEATSYLENLVKTKRKGK